MPRRRGSGQGSSRGTASQRGNSGGIRKNTRTRQAPHRYGQNPENQATPSRSEETVTLESESEPIDGSEYGTPSRNQQSDVPAHSTPGSASQHSETSALSSEPILPHQSSPPTAESISLQDMRELLRSHEEDIVNQVVRRLQPQVSSPAFNRQHNYYPVPEPPRREQHTDPTLLRIAELEAQLSQLRAEREPRARAAQASRELGTYSSIPLPAVTAIESASGTVESVEALFPGVERSTLTQIIENKFKPTNIYRLLATERDRAESQRTICIGGVEFEQAERDGKVGEYRMSSFFKAWAAYSGILVKLAPYGLQGDLATALFIYTMTLYDLLERYTWEGVKAYHFQFHRKRVASGTSLYLPTEWRQLDSELVASKCFANPIVRSTWSQDQIRTNTLPRRLSELPYRDPPHSSRSHSSVERRAILPSSHQGTAAGGFPTTTTQAIPQTCRN